MMLAAISLAADMEKPQVSSVCTVAPNILLVQIHAQHVEYGRQVPYEAQPGDDVAKGMNRIVKRNGHVIGALAGKDGKILFTADRIEGQPLDLAWATKPESYRLVSKDDPNYANGVVPQKINRKSRPVGITRTADNRVCAQDHLLYLTLPNALQTGKHYVIEFQNDPLAEPSVEFNYDPVSQPSDAVHVGQVGFRPDDPAKVAFLSCWMGDGGGVSYKDGLAFSLIDQKSGKAVFEGKTKLAKRATETEVGQLNEQMSDVFEMDFSAFKTPGTYRVSVEGVGCSLRFPIADDAWMKAFYTSARGLYHQRSGIELGPPYTEFKRPRGFHPADGVKVYDTRPAKPGEKAVGFQGLGFKTDTILPDAWGGYMDAGDWDRRPLHIYVPRLLLDLYDLSASAFDKVNLNEPESKDDIPDLLNEALWEVDFCKRIQTPDGGIRPGINSSEHPRRGEGSWDESLDVMAYPPTAGMSYDYAAVAAHAAFILQKTHPDMAKGYQESALKAFEWAEKHPLASRSGQGAQSGRGQRGRGARAAQASQATPDKATASASQASQPAQGSEEAESVQGGNDSATRILAAAEFFRLTGDAKWQDIFLAGTRFKDASGQYIGHPRGSGIFDRQTEAGWVYFVTERPGMNQAVKDNFKKALLDAADERIAAINDTAFRWVGTKNDQGISTTVVPYAVELVRAHYVTHDEKYLRGIVLSCQQGTGANPLNMCYTSGVGVKFQQRMVHEDSYVSHQPLPTGLTTNGPVNPRNPVPGNWVTGFTEVQQFVYPDAKTWPTLESWFDIGFISPMCEFTVHRNIAPVTYIWGYLAARK